VGSPTMLANGRGALEVFGPRATQDATHGGVLERARKGELDVLVVAGDSAGASDPAGKVRGVWLAPSLLQEHPDVPGFVDVVLPLAHPYEQVGSFVNLEGRVQAFEAAGVAPSGALADWHALVRLSSELGAPLPVEVRALREKLTGKNALFTRIPRVSKVSLTVVR
jgi:predicted molibdopterin-dependent oxidoreductase YjgC